MQSEQRKTDETAFVNLEKNDGERLVSIKNIYVLLLWLQKKIELEQVLRWT